MSKDKHEKEEGSSNSETRDESLEQTIWGSLPVELQKEELAKYFPLNEIVKLVPVSKANRLFFQAILDKAKKVHPLLKAVVEANPEELRELVRANPKLLFQKGQVKDPAGQRFYNVSPYQLMTFLADVHMLEEIMPLVPQTQEMKEIRLAQYNEIDSGGPDLVKMAVDPTLLTFDRVLHHTETYIDRTYGRELHATFPLLENPDGLIYYKDDAGAVHFYYADQAKKTVKEVYPKEQKAFDALAASMDAMENNSSRRSSNEEHRLIASTFCDPNKKRPLALHRKGIQYDDCDSVRYCGHRFDFNRYYNTNRQCIRLYNERKPDEGDRVWIKLGKQQKELMWRLQFLCQKDLPFDPRSNFNSVKNMREFEFVCDRIVTTDELIFSNGALDARLGKQFALYRWELGGACTHFLSASHAPPVSDLVTVCRLVEGAKAAVNEFKHEQDSPQNAGPNP